MYNMYDCLTVEELHLFFFCLCIFFDLAGFLLRAGNWLFLPAVQVNVTGCFTEIFTEIIQRMFVCSKVKSHCVYGKILLSPSNQSCEDIWHMLPLR